MFGARTRGLQRAVIPTLVLLATLTSTNAIDGSDPTAARNNRTVSGFFSSNPISIGSSAGELLGRVEKLLATQDSTQVGVQNTDAEGQSTEGKNTRIVIHHHPQEQVDIASGGVPISTGSEPDEANDVEESSLHQSLMHAVKHAISLQPSGRSHVHPHPHPHTTAPHDEWVAPVTAMARGVEQPLEASPDNKQEEAASPSLHPQPHPHPHPQSSPASHASTEVATAPEEAKLAVEGAAADEEKTVTFIPQTPAAPHKSVVLVANGRSVLKRKMGTVIDSFDIVARFNYFELGSFTPFVGTRTDLWFLGEMKVPGPKRVRGKHTSFTSKRQMNLKIRPTMKYIVPVVYQYKAAKCTPKNPKACLWGKPEQQRVRKLQKEIFMDYNKYGLAGQLELVDMANQFTLATKYGYSEPYPSSGVMAIVYCLENFGAPVTIHGYDFMGKSLGHYFEKVKKTWTSHSMGGEGKFITKLINRGLVNVL